MPKPDDSSLSPEDLRFIERRAHNLLDRADAWNVFPVPIDDLLAAANVKVAPTSLFDPIALMAYLKGKAEEAGNLIKSAVSKIFGIYDAGDNLRPCVVAGPTFRTEDDPSDVTLFH